MIRGLILFLKIGLIVAAAIYLARYPGHVSIDWMGWRIDLSLALLGAMLLTITVLAVILVRLWIGTMRAPAKIVAARRASRRDRGYRALTQGMVAVAAGDAQEAKRQAQKAEGLLNDPPLTRLLSAQAAQLQGDDQAASKYFKAMLEDPHAAFLGMRGLMMQALDKGDDAEADRLAEKAHELRPDAIWATERVIDARQRLGDWDGAMKALVALEKSGALSQEFVKPRRSELLLAKAQESQREGDTANALKTALEARKLNPTSASATASAARLLHFDGKTSRAAKLIEETWRAAPDPILARVYKEVAPADTDALKHVKRFEKLLSFNPAHIESHIALAEAALEASLWGEARTHLSAALESFTDQEQVPARLCRLMASLEEQEHGNIEESRRWLMRAVGG